MALSLADRGLRPVLIEEAEHVGAAWRRRYDRLRLNTAKHFSHLPGRAYPKTTPVFPTRDDVVAHLEHFADDERIDLRLSTSVQRIDRRDAGWCVQTKQDLSTRPTSSSRPDTNACRSSRKAEPPLLHR
jgi:cation diffusion facilitator CzcD-associated flavoprotein CzcO